MAITYEIDPDRLRVTMTLTGSISNGDLVDVRARMEADPAFEAASDLIVDASEADVTGLVAGVLRERAALPLPVCGRVALVTPTDHGFGLARMYSTLSGMNQHPGKVAAFRTMEEALHWISGGAETRA